MFRPLLAVSAALTVALAFAADAFAVQGAVHGTNTVDYIGTSINPGESRTVTVSATGLGDNQLKVEVEHFDFVRSRWVAIERMHVAPGSTASLHYTAPNSSAYPMAIRYRLGRKLGSLRIDYTLTEE